MEVLNVVEQQDKDDISTKGYSWNDYTDEDDKESSSRADRFL
jgi:hypothetical protein